MKKINSIFIIDDSPIIVFGIQKILSSLNICKDISTYGNGKLALDEVKDKIAKNLALPEIIFLDINMPILDGWQFLEEFIKLPLKQKIRINIITSSIDATDMEKYEFFKVKTNHLIAFKNKPFNKKDVAEITKLA